jgi:methylated-DNA-[protein]-cysteine S-methyltransferase
MSYALIDTPLGPIGLDWESETLTGVDLAPEPVPGATPASNQEPPAAIARQLAAYFADGRCGFDLPVAIAGTPFQRRVWSAMCASPPGQTRTYGDLARELGSAPRAVGQACRANPCPIVVPCHRVVAANGLGGFAGDLTGRKVAVKRWLLRHEGALGSTDGG